jgi:putative DNA primase/helicase
VVELLAGRLHQQADAAEDALVAAKAPVYTQGGFLVRSVVEQADAARGRKTLVARIMPCDRDWLLRRLSQEVRAVKYRQTQDGPQAVTADVPKALADVLLSSASVKFSELAGIIETPTLRPDGSILSQPGYDAATGLLLVNPPPMPVIPEQPTRGDAEQALQTLDELLSEFPFADAASRSVALSALVTPVVRGALAFAPLHVATAPIAGSGKSFLFDTAAAIATGKECPVLSAGANNEETEKRLHGAALSGQPLISIDNLNGVLRGDFLCQLTTQALVEVRRLGSTGNFRIRNCATVFANGNNIEIEGDLVRRTIRCTLNPEMENPEAREFRGNPFRAVLADRGKFVAAALTLVRAHLVANEPASVKPLAGFEDWSRLVRAALVWLGCADPVGTQEELRTEDPAVVALDLVVEAWAKLIESNTDKDRAFTATELLEQNDNDLDRELRAATNTRNDQALSTVKVGQFLKRHQGRVRRGAKVVAKYDTHSKRQTWQLVGWANLLAPPATTETASGDGNDKVVPFAGQRAKSGKKATRKANKAEPGAEQQWQDLPGRPWEKW